MFSWIYYSFSKYSLNLRLNSNMVEQIIPSEWHTRTYAKLYFRLIPSLFISGIPIRNICQTFDCTQIGHFLPIFIQNFLFQYIDQLRQKKKSHMFNISTFCLTMIVSFLDKKIAAFVGLESQQYRQYSMGLFSSLSTSHSNAIMSFCVGIGFQYD